MLVNLPGATMDDAINHTNEAFAADNGALYVNLCTPEHIEGIGASLPEENIIYHENIWGAMKTSRYFGSLLLDNYDLQPYVDSQYTGSEDYFKQILTSFDLLRVTDPDEYREAIKKPYLNVYESDGDTITVAGTDYISEEPGRSIVVFDLNMNRVVDFVTIRDKELIRQWPPGTGF